jgi:hypothetical protein
LSKGKGEKIFIYLDWTARKIEGKGGRQQSFKKDRMFMQKKLFQLPYSGVKNFERECGQVCV